MPGVQYTLAATIEGGRTPVLTGAKVRRCYYRLGQAPLARRSLPRGSRLAIIQKARTCSNFER